MAKIKYQAKENTTVGAHSFYSVPVLNGTLTYDELLEQAAEKTSIEPEILRASVDLYMKAIKDSVLRGFRCQLGNSFLTVYPTLKGSVKDTPTHVATAADLKAQNCRSRLGCTVAVAFSDEFEKNVSWQKVDQNGTEITDEDITDDTDNTTTGGNTGTTTNPSTGDVVED